MEVSGSKAAAAAAYESIGNMGKEKEGDKESELSDIWGSDSGSDDDNTDDDNTDDDNMDDDYVQFSENDYEYPVDPIWNLIYPDDSDGLMKFLNLPKDGNHCSSIGQKDPDYKQLKHAFRLSCFYNKLGCLKALLNCGVDWFAGNAVGQEHLLRDACIAGSKNAAELVIACAKEKKAADKLLGADDEGTTPLHLAAICGSCIFIQLLLDQGADPCKRNAKHKLPCDYANPGTKAWKLLVDAVLKKV